MSPLFVIGFISYGHKTVRSCDLKYWSNYHEQEPNPQLFVTIGRSDFKSKSWELMIIKPEKGGNGTHFHHHPHRKIGFNKTITLPDFPLTTHLYTHTRWYTRLIQVN